MTNHPHRRGRTVASLRQDAELAHYAGRYELARRLWEEANDLEAQEAAYRRWLEFVRPRVGYGATAEEAIADLEARQGENTS